MAIDVRVEKTFPLSHPKSFGCNRSYHTVLRWASIGCTSRVNGNTVLLDTVYIGGQRETSREAYLRFIEQLNEQETK